MEMSLWLKMRIARDAMEQQKEWPCHEMQTWLTAIEGMD